MMGTERESRGAAGRLRREVRRLLRIHVLAVWAAVLALGLLAAALAHSLLFASGEAGVPGFLFSWASLIATALAVLAGAWRSFRIEEVERLVRENLLLNHPDQRKELETWLSTELVGSHAELARELVERRLDRGLAQRDWAPLRRSHFAAMALVLAGCLALALLHVLLGVSPARGIERYLQGFLARGMETPPRISGLSLQESWIRESDLERLEVSFDREPAAPAEVRARSEQWELSRALVRAEPLRYRTSLPPCSGKLSLHVAVGRRVSEEFRFQVYPREPVRVSEVRWLDGQGNELGKSAAAASPVPIPEGALVQLDLRASPCPLAAFGLGGKKRGELGLKDLGGGAFLAEFRLLEDESFRAFWQFPGGAAQLGSELSLQVQPSPTPEVRILSPREGDLVESGTIRVSCRSRCSGEISRGLVFASDYLGVQWTWELPAEKREDGEWRLEFDLPLQYLMLGSSRVLGVCAAFESGGLAPKMGFSQAVNAVLSESLKQKLAGLTAAWPGKVLEYPGDPVKGSPREIWFTGDPRTMAMPGDGAEAGDPTELAQGEQDEEGCEECGAEMDPTERLASERERQGRRVCAACVEKRKKEGRCIVCGGT